MSRLTKEIVHHSSLAIGQVSLCSLWHCAAHLAFSFLQGFCPIRLDYVPYLRSALLTLLHQAANSASTSDGVQQVRSISYGGGRGLTALYQVIDLLDSYGLSREDCMESLREMQFLVENDKAAFKGTPSCLVDNYVSCSRLLLLAAA